jgi:hypothetical protein
MTPRNAIPSASQRGAGLLTIVAVLGVILVLVQGGVYYRSRGSVKFLGSERGKILAQQAAEAGVEANIGDLGRRKIKVRAGLADTPTYVQKALGTGRFSTTLSTVAIGAAADTVDLVSTGIAGKGTHTVHARLKLRKTLDTTTTTTAKLVSDSTLAVGTRTETDTTLPSDPAAMPALNTTAAYSACLALPAGTKCSVCHIPQSPFNLKNRTVLNISNGLIPSHAGHLGDYMGTSCSQYDTTLTAKTVPDSVWTVSSTTKYDTTVAVDTLVKVRILSWR